MNGQEAPNLARQVDTRTGVPYVRTTARIYGERQIRTFTAMCTLAGRRPHELTADLVLEAIRRAQCDHEIQHAVTELAAELDRQHDGPACRMCGCTENAACVGGCWWVPDPLLLGDLCSACLAFVGQAQEAEPEDVSEDVSEADAIGALLARLPGADVAELLQVAGTCPAAHIAGYAVQAAALLEGLRAELTAVVQAAHGEALAAQEWIASLEAHTEPDTRSGHAA